MLQNIIPRTGLVPTPILFFESTRHLLLAYFLNQKHSKVGVKQAPSHD